jgi:hypothetical protein
MLIGTLPLAAANDASALDVFFGGSIIQLTGLALATDEHVALLMSPGATNSLIRSSDTNGVATTLTHTSLAAGMTIRGCVIYPIDE